MKSYIFTAAALLAAVASGTILPRQEQGSQQGGEAPVDRNSPCGAKHTTTYQVMAGDTLSSISYKTGAGICDIATENDLPNINVVNAGVTLIIPTDCTKIDNTTCLTPTAPPATEICIKGLPSSYGVRSGDSLSAIAADFNITLPALLGANPQIANPDAIDVGQQINVPVCPNSSCSPVGPYEIRAGDIFFDLAKNYTTTIGQLKALNPTIVPEKIAVGQQIILPKNCLNITAPAS